VALTRTDVEKIAHLARLAISDADTRQHAQALSNILGMIDQIQAVDTTAIIPMAHPLDATQRLRPDVVTETNQREHFQAIAPKTENGLYLVPQVIE
jgi:aspartyl-tRNA(Asn)/glutamyl-tRNA(Gln) amidotransferase subunit C